MSAPGKDDNEEMETDACAEAPGATAGYPRIITSGASGSQPASTTTRTRIDFTGSDGSKFVVQTSGAAPNMQVGSHNVMHVVDKAVYYDATPKRPKINIKAQKPIVQSKEVPGSDAMDIVARYIGRDWKSLGRKLGLEDGELDNIKIDYYAEGQYEVSYQMLRKWKELAYPTELNKLAKACSKIGRGDIADKLADRYGGGSH